MEKSPDLSELQVSTHRVKNLTTTNNQHKTSHTENKTKHPTRLDPTRYGDWEKKGRCIDF